MKRTIAMPKRKPTNDSNDYLRKDGLMPKEKKQKTDLCEYDDNKFNVKEVTNEDFKNYINKMHD